MSPCSRGAAVPFKACVCVALLVLAFQCALLLLTPQKAPLLNLPWKIVFAPKALCNHTTFSSRNDPPPEVPDTPPSWARFAGWTFWAPPQKGLGLDLPAIFAHCSALDKVRACLDWLHGGAARGAGEPPGGLAEALSAGSAPLDDVASTPPPPVQLFHLFWQGPVNDKVALVCQSFLYTQPLDRSRLIAWILPAGGQPLDEALKASPFSKLLLPYHPHVEFRLWNETEQFLDSPFEPLLGQLQVHEGDVARSEEDYSRTWESPVGAGYSDVVRFCLLWGFGGVYIDTDVLLLRDFTPLFEIDFSYRWESLEQFNTAVLGLRRGSPGVQALVESMVNGPKEPKAANFHPREVLHHANSTGMQVLVPWEADSIDWEAFTAAQSANAPHLVMFSSHLFDPLWLRYSTGYESDWKERGLHPDLNTQPASFLTETPRESGGMDLRSCAGFFGGAFAHHWHNHHWVPIRAESYAGVFWRCYQNFLAGLQPNLYGKMFTSSGAS